LLSQMAGAIERRSDVGPDEGLYADLMQGLGAGIGAQGGGGGVVMGASAYAPSFAEKSRATSDAQSAARLAAKQGEPQKRIFTNQAVQPAASAAGSAPAQATRSLSSGTGMAGRSMGDDAFDRLFVGGTVYGDTPTGVLGTYAGNQQVENPELLNFGRQIVTDRLRMRPDDYKKRVSPAASVGARVIYGN
jgi:hypothetical protein